MRTATQILVLYYTNDALDQFLEEIFDMGVDQHKVLPLGSEFTAQTEPMTLYDQTRQRESEAEIIARRVVDRGMKFSRLKQSNKEILDSLEFDKQEGHYCHALSIPENGEHMYIGGSDGKAIDRPICSKGGSMAKMLACSKDRVTPQHRGIWHMTRAERQKHLARWTHHAISKRNDGLAAAMQDYDADYGRWTNARENRIAELMKNKRIIGCMTIAAAKYGHDWRSSATEAKGKELSSNG
ncbi:hypothetical protein LTR17_017441 [Elasticomyces elasticus]|nr:hypothetical protein LTR17_017441 [Elasticomyces elasticus]